MIFLNRPYNFHTLFLNSLAKPFANVFSIVEIKYTIFVNQSTTTRIELQPQINGNFVIKSTKICVQGFSDIELDINLPASCSMQFLFLWQESHPSMYCFIFFVTSGHQKFLVTSSTVFYCPLCPPTSVLQYSLIISTLNISSLGIYTFSFLYITLFTSFHSSSLNIFTPAHFISLMAFTTSLSFIFDCFTFSSRLTPSTIIFIFSVFLTFSYSGFTNVLFLLSLSTLTSQSGLLLKLSTFSILLSRICFSIKSNLDRYRAHLACLLFNFCVFMKYSRFL